jgi:hypothetical protein
MAYLIVAVDVIHDGGDLMSSTQRERLDSTDCYCWPQVTSSSALQTSACSDERLPTAWRADVLLSVARSGSFSLGFRSKEGGLVQREL